METGIDTGILVVGRDGELITWGGKIGEVLSAAPDANMHQYLQDCGNRALKLVEKDGCTEFEWAGQNLMVSVFSLEDQQKPWGGYRLIQFSLKNAVSGEKVESYTKKRVLRDLQEIIEASFDGILVTDALGNVEIVNQGYVHNTGISKEELLGRNILELVNPVWMKQSVVTMVQKKKESVSLQHLTRNGKSIVVTGTPLFDEKGQIKKIVVNSRDISEIYELTEELESAKKMEEYYIQHLKSREQEGEEKEGVVVVNERMQQVFKLARKLGNFNTNVLITGESGVGKDEVATFIHKNGLRRDKPYIAVNCGAVPENLLESELFGYESGAFTGAQKNGKKGLFEIANEGTLFLDEIGEIPPSLQVKLLRALENREILRLGGTKPIPLNVRIVAATNQELTAMVKAGKFREDLFYRLNVVNISIPPLRERKDEIPLLCLKFVHQYNQQYGGNKKVTYPVIQELERYSWPGNIRELKNVIENMFVLSDEEYLRVQHIPWIKKRESPAMELEVQSLEAAVQALERELLMEAKDRFSTTRQIAEYLKVNQSTVVRKMKKYQL